MGFEKGWNPFMEYNNIEVVSVSTEKTVLIAHIKDTSLNPYGMIHGGLLYTMIDCAAGITARADGNPYVTQNSYVNYLSNAAGKERIYAESVRMPAGERAIRPLTCSTFTRCRLVNVTSFTSITSSRASPFMICICAIRSLSRIWLPPSME